jgi:hypothetical protein
MFSIYFFRTTKGNTKKLYKGSKELSKAFSGFDFKQKNGRRDIPARDR